MSIDIAYVDPGPEGYSPYIYVAELAAELLGGRLIRIPLDAPTRVQKVLGLLPRSKGADQCLLIAHAPYALSAFSAISGWRNRYQHLVAWVFDSFWVDQLSRLLKLAQPFDRVFVTEADDLDTWTKHLSAPVEWLPWGTEALRMGSSNPNRSVDLFRIGRQPPPWTDDAATAAACAARQIRFAGRPPGSHNATENQRIVTNAFADAKFSLSFSNSVSPSVQTHPIREYITGRWTDALASGTTVAGVPPRCPSIEKLMWPGALLDLGTTALDKGLDVIAEALAAWTPAHAERNHMRSLEKLDWRLRLEVIAQSFGGPVPPRLQAELVDLRSRVAAWHTKVQTPV